MRGQGATGAPWPARSGWRGTPRLAIIRRLRRGRAARVRGLGGRPVVLEAESDPRRRDGEFRGALVYGAALAATSALAYLFNAVMGRKLSAQDFGTLGALIATMLVLSGPVSALYGGAAMSSARSGKVARLPWQRW